MIKIIRNLLNRENKKIMFSLVTLLIISASVSVYSFLQPTTITNQINDNTAQFQTTYDYKATVTPNVLNPNGGTIEVGDTIFKKVTTAIPFDLKTTVKSENPLTIKGTHEVKLLVKAGELWERTFPLEEKQYFEQTGKDLSIVDNAYTIDIAKLKTFITQVEEEIGVRPEQYALEVIPTIQGTINFNGKEEEIQPQERLVFQYAYDEINLASEKTFTSNASFTTTQTIKSTFQLIGVPLPLIPVRTASTILFILLLISVSYAYRDLVISRHAPSLTQMERINKKHGSRIIPVTQKVTTADKSIFTLDTFKSIIKIADEKELPIFCCKDHQDGGAAYFIVDGDYMYNYETSRTELIRSAKKVEESDKAYARG
ncbi:DUF5305 family protein [Virgibacillus sp. DJP39]|uniref:DUF5305 family protein n=1 Tax=Virgibacillus sp. DJP39 TaxID=3409790 RepID=UPI003BB79896